MSLLSSIGSFFKSAVVTPGGDPGWGSYGWGYGPNWYDPWGSTPSSRINYGVEAGDPLQNAIVLACIGWIIRTFPEAPIRVLRRPDGAARSQAEEMPAHPLTKLLAQPNPYYSGLLLWQGILASLTLDGNAYVLKFKNGMDQVGELWYEPHTTIRPMWDEKGDEFIAGYQVMRKGQWSDLIPRERVIHFRNGMDPDNPRLGLSPLKAAMREIFTDNEAANWSASLLRNAAVPSLVVSPDVAGTTISNPESLKTTITAKFTGDRRGEPLVMQGPTKVQQLGFTPEQMNLEKLRNIPEERITALIGVPAVVAGLGSGLDHMTYHNYGEAKASGYESNIIPTQRLLAAQLATDLLPSLGDPDTEYIDFDLTQVKALSDDQTEIVKRITMAYQGGWMKRKDAIRLSGLGMEADDVTDDLYITDLTRMQERISEVEPAGTLIGPDGLPTTQVDAMAAASNGHRQEG